MTMKRLFATVAASLVLLLTTHIAAQAPTPDAPPPATVMQLMRSIFFVNANVVFAGQVENPDALPRDSRSSLSPNPLTGLYGGWQALENSALALADAAELLNTRGRVCSNGTPVPVDEAQWKSAVAGMRAVGLEAAAAARTRSQEKIFEVSEKLTDACGACHRVYRQRGNPCTAPAPRAERASPPPAPASSHPSNTSRTPVKAPTARIEAVVPSGGTTAAAAIDSASLRRDATVAVSGRSPRARAASHTPPYLHTFNLRI